MGTTAQILDVTLTDHGPLGGVRWRHRDFLSHDPDQLEDLAVALFVAAEVPRQAQIRYAVGGAA
jgi:hypothetical protein